MDLGQIVAQRILQLCKENEITVNKLSYGCGITQSTLNNIVNGQSKNPKLATIKKICDGLDMTLNEFFNTDAFNYSEPEVK